MIVTIPTITLDNWYHPGTAVNLRIAALSTFVAADGEMISGANSPVAWWRDISCTVGERTDTSGRKIRTLTIPEFTISSTIDSDDPSAKYFAAFWADGGVVQQWTAFEAFSIPDTASTQTWAEIRSYNALSSATPPAWVAIIVQNLASDPTDPTPGQIYFNTTDEEFRFWDGTAWGTLGSGGGGSGTVTNVTGTAPISVATGTTTPVVSIAAATSGAAGSMSATDKAKLDAATNANTVSTIVMRDASGDFSAGTITATLNGNASTSTTTTTIPSLSGDVTNVGNAVQIATGVIVNSDVNPSAAIALSKLATDPLARANHTGTQLASTVSDFDTQVRTSRLDQMAAPTASVSFNTHLITNVLDPVSAQDAATKAYADTFATSAGNGILKSSGVFSARIDTNFLQFVSGVISFLKVCLAKVLKNGTSVSDGLRTGINFIEGSGVTLTVADNAGSDRVDVTIAAAGGSGVSLQGSSPGTADTGNSNITGVAIAGKTAIAISSPSFGTNNIALFGANPGTVDNAANVIISTASASHKGLVIQGKSGQTGAWIQTQNSSGQGLVELSETDGAGYILIKNAGSTVLEIYKNGTGGITFLAPSMIFNSSGWSVNTSNNFVPVLDNTRDLGSASLRPRDGWFARTLTTASRNVARRSITANRTLDDTDELVLVDASGGAVTVTLPAASGVDGRVYTVKKTDSSGNTVTIDGNGSETIDGATTKVLSSQWETARIACNGTGWFLI